MGYQPTDQDFLRAVTTADIKAVRLLLSVSRFHIRRENFHLLFSELAFNAPILDLLIQQQAVDSHLCPTESQTVTLYVRASSNLEKARYLKEVCGTIQVRTALLTSLNRETQRVREAEAAVEVREKVRQRCRAKYFDEGERTLIEAAAHFNLLGHDTYAERECVLARLNASLLSGGYDLVRGPQTFRSVVGECCDRYNRSLTIDRSHLDELNAAILFLRDG